MKNYIVWSMFFFLITGYAWADSGAKMVIDYEYDKQSGASIASKATAYYDFEIAKMRVAYAEVVEVVKRNSDPEFIKVKEIQYNPEGWVSYEGYIIFRSDAGNKFKEEYPIFGVKQDQVFEIWPSR